jgi:protein farnesyltransferase subunit beta
MASLPFAQFLASKEPLWTRTQGDQRRTQMEVADCLAASTRDSRSLANEIAFFRQNHAHYLLKGLHRLPGGYACLDASRPWLVYWSLHALTLLDDADENGDDAANTFVDGDVDAIDYNAPMITAELRANTIDFLRRCQHPDGGFGGGPQQHAHVAPTYAAISALATLGGTDALDVVDRPRLYAFLMRMKHASGGFTTTDGGEVDTRGSYCAVAVGRWCDLLFVAFISVLFLRSASALVAFIHLCSLFMLLLR